MSQTPQGAETPAPSPGPGGPRPAPGPSGPPRRGNARRPQSAGPAPDYGDGRDSGPEPAPPDPVARPVLNSPGTTAHWPPWPDTAPPTTRPVGVPGRAASSGQ